METCPIQSCKRLTASSRRFAISDLIWARSFSDATTGELVATTSSATNWKTKRLGCLMVTTQTGNALRFNRELATAAPSPMPIKLPGTKVKQAKTNRQNRREAFKARGFPVLPRTRQRQDH